MKKENPFEPVTVKLRVPIKSGEVEVKEITLKPPVLRDVLRTDGYHPDSVGYARALLSALSGLPEVLLDNLVPEDWADLRILLAQVNLRFMGLVNLLDKKEDKTKDPTTAGETGNDTAMQTSEPTSAA